MNCFISLRSLVIYSTLEYHNGTKVYILFAKNNEKTYFFVKSLYGLIEKVKSSNISSLDDIFDAKTQQKQ